MNRASDIATIGIGGAISYKAAVEAFQHNFIEALVTNPISSTVGICTILLVILRIIRIAQKIYYNKEGGG